MCYKKVTVLNKKYNDEFDNFCAEYTENTNASTTEKESEQLSPIVDSGATVADDEKSNVEDLSSIFGDFDKEQSTSTASTSSKIICLFCDRSQKRCGKKLINLTFPSSDKVPQQIKDMAKNFGDLEILSKLQHQTIAYHLPCYAVYQSKEKRSMEESTDSSYSKYRQLHQLAFQSISNFIETEIIENNKVMYLAQLFLRYQALLLEFGNYEIDFDDIQDYRSETLQKKLIRKFGDRITIEASTAIRNKKIVYKTDMDVSVMANNFKLLETKNDYEFENVAYYLRSCIKNIDAHPLPRNVTADDIIRGECDIPEQLFDFMRNVIQGPNISDENSDKLKVKITSICSDIIYAVTRGTCKPAKSLTLGLAMKSLTNSRQVITILNRYGHTIAPLPPALFSCTGEMLKTTKSTMPYKVVQTIENGKICLSVVPNNWEKEGTLSWPPRSEASSILDENSVPGKNWSTFPCIVKRICNTYKAAGLAVKAMENVTDTDEEVPTRVIPLPQENDAVLDLNHLMEVDGDSTAVVSPITVTISDNAMADRISLTSDGILPG
ncbi:hypothetical protein HW555_013402 [Spodoptera exigua]|uniref:Uncharacterized protein n=1 Tax=Spodoptera exigua TaxID=7107 RepID=A0A835KZT9_SPOEX|nr:hypothetical protein HW555_013402 [Spodoptera exigua]